MRPGADSRTPAGTLPVLCHTPVAHLGVAEVPRTGNIDGVSAAATPSPSSRAAPASSPHATRHRRPGAASPPPGSLRRPTPSSQRHAAALRHASRRMCWMTSSSSCAPDPTRRPPRGAFIPKYHCLPFFRISGSRARRRFFVRRRVDDARVNDRPRAQPMAARRQVRIDLLRPSPRPCFSNRPDSSGWWSRRAAPPSTAAPHGLPRAQVVEQLSEHAASPTYGPDRAPPHRTADPSLQAGNQLASRNNSRRVRRRQSLPVPWLDHPIRDSCARDLIRLSLALASRRSRRRRRPQAAPYPLSRSRGRRARACSGANDRRRAP